MLVDDHAVVRAGYKRFIELDPVLKVIAEASSGEEAYTFLESNKAGLKHCVGYSIVFRNKKY